ncbi:MAG: PKD domain-containing protein, partial [Bacteroidales bacterium]|nr:PKD domain-containing protein [Bacteroidales bacterium]
MKTIWQYIAIAALAVSAAACTPEYPTPNQAGLPQASDLDVTISVDQTTNYVTFVMNNKGVVPVWIFGDQKIDGKAGKKYSYTDNNVSLRFRDAGEYTVEVKAYNANGLSQGSLVKTFTLDNTYRDPFDPSPYVKAISNGASQTWVWNSTEAGHIACGPVGDPKGWWQVEPNGKKGFLYDDLMTFASDGTYTFDPVDGQAYAKKDAEYPAGHEILDDDY